MAAFAEFEREMIRERVKAGMLAARHKGKRFGRPRAVFDRSKAQRLRGEGYSVRQIARKLGVGKGTISRACGGT